MPPLTVGFDLDMTLLDTRPGIAAAFRALTELTGVPIDAEAAVSRLGPPLRVEIARWFPPEQVEETVRIYRELYPAYAITPAVPLPGARAAIEAVRERGGRVLVVTAKHGRLARLHLDHLGLVVDEVAGDLFAEEKATGLRAHGATHYVGDHVADMVAAGAAGVPGIAVATGPCSADELRAAGAATVLADLTGFPAALDGMIRLALRQ
ncbi:HAD family hydrolase [Micromonospora sp. WMMD1082]|uniref:HAD family hydrolase n=1 Tax=Micromonospora sp. WMMD1082 TaxID=3016104 RepID=UPI0024168820|nr:HAD family hydrolase [Micromonospora sp. WMMD1082]MDG4795781.1 HAD family hydrolase [Micromonospora sp. WMMD1082]